MDINYLIQLLGNRLNGLTLAKDQAFSSGDLERINTIDAEILEVKNTISKLNLVASIEQTAAATPFTEAQVVQNGIEASFNPTVITDATKCLLEYDITPYATDPMHELKIQNILEKMGLMDSPDKVDFYIKKTSPDSPLDGLMVWNASTQYLVDVRLMLALMELDSRFGTLGLATSTFNPGNVGNDGVNTKTYHSWNDGVLAVASWLNTHRKNNLTNTDTIDVVPTPQQEPVQIIEPVNVEVPKDTTPIVEAAPDEQKEIIPEIVPEVATTPPENTISEPNTEVLVGE